MSVGGRESGRVPLKAWLVLGVGAALLMAVGLPMLRAFTQFDRFGWRMLIGSLGVSFIGFATAVLAALLVSGERLTASELTNRSFVAGLWGLTFAPIVYLCVVAALQATVLGLATLIFDAWRPSEERISPGLVVIVVLLTGLVVCYLAARLWLAPAVMAAQGVNVWVGMAQSWRVTARGGTLGRDLGVIVLGLIWVLASLVSAVVSNGILLTATGVLGLVFLPFAQVHAAKSYGRLVA